MNVDLSTCYMGLQLRNPLMVAACPLTGKLDTLRQLEDAGAAAAVLPSLFEEQIEHEETAVHHLHEFHTESFAESLDYFPELDAYNTGPDNYLDHIRAAKQAVDIPIIASLNGVSAGGWTRYARMIEEAGADALELNIYLVPIEPDFSSQQVEASYIKLVSFVRHTVSLPLAVKIGPYFSSLPDMSERLADAGAGGLVLFNRYLDPDIDLETLDVVPHLALSTREEIHLPLRWIAILRDRVKASLAATSGVHESDDVIKVLLAGADVAMMASALLERGPPHLTTVLGQMQSWLVEHEYDSVEQLKGSVSQKNCADPSAFVRSNYMKSLVSYSGKFI
jgi:dihydroorotate dehydrogenase (fumarate)